MINKITQMIHISLNSNIISFRFLKENIITRKKFTSLYITPFYQSYCKLFFYSFLFRLSGKNGRKKGTCIWAANC